MGDDESPVSTRRPKLPLKRKRTGEIEVTLDGTNCQEVKAYAVNPAESHECVVPSGNNSPMPSCLPIRSPQRPRVQQFWNFEDACFSRAILTANRSFTNLLRDMEGEEDEPPVIAPQDVESKTLRMSSVGLNQQKFKYTEGNPGQNVSSNALLQPNPPAKRLGTASKGAESKTLLAPPFGIKEHQHEFLEADPGLNVSSKTVQHPNAPDKFPRAASEGVESKTPLPPPGGFKKHQLRCTETDPGQNVNSKTAVHPNAPDKPPVTGSQGGQFKTLVLSPDGLNEHKLRCSEANPRQDVNSNIVLHPNAADKPPGTDSQCVEFETHLASPDGFNKHKLKCTEANPGQSVSSNTGLRPNAPDMYKTPGAVSQGVVFETLVAPPVGVNGHQLKYIEANTGQGVSSSTVLHPDAPSKPHGTCSHGVEPDTLLESPDGINEHNLKSIEANPGRDVNSNKVHPNAPNSIAKEGQNVNSSTLHPYAADTVAKESQSINSNAVHPNASDTVPKECENLILGTRTNHDLHKTTECRINFQYGGDTDDYFEADSKAVKKEQASEDTGSMIWDLDEELDQKFKDVLQAEEIIQHSPSSSDHDSRNENLLYGEEMIFHGFVRENDRNFKIHRVFSVDICACMRRNHTRNSKVLQKVGKGSASIPRRRLGRWDRGIKPEVATVPEVDEVFSGAEWKSFNPRTRVKTVLSQFNYLVSFYRSLSISRPAVAAGQYLRAKRFCFNEGRGVVGRIPGVRVGDKFNFREELRSLIISRNSQAGIECIPASLSGYVDKNGRPVSVAVSVVYSREYKDNEYDGETLIYVGSGGDKNLVNQRLKSSESTDHKEKDQKLVRGNLALRNSCDLGVPVRVIRGEMYYEEGRRMRKRYWYDGLYDVKKWYKSVGSAGSKVWKFRLVKRKKQTVMAFNR
ncbi:hypothetical protein R1flu_012540 [Riccia fluitans]|uniref:YDG domain-containing protein n=1 Tax=Riccia fluitans TaxID=41844 RepID=A0ABD1ZAX0_9MARC